MAVNSCWLASILWTYANAPASKAALTTVASWCCDKNSIFTPGESRKMRMAAAIPLSFGSPRSRTTTSGFNSYAFSTASIPSAASAITCNCASFEIIEQVFLRHSLKSSTTITRAATTGLLLCWKIIERLGYTRQCAFESGPRLYSRTCSSCGKRVSLDHRPRCQFSFR